MRSRVARLLTATTLALVTGSTGLVTLAGPALGDVPAPTITASPASPSRTVTPTWSFDTTDPTGAWECSVDRSPASTPIAWQPCGLAGTPASDYAPTLAADGSWTFSVRQVVPGTPALIAQSAPYVLDTLATATVAPVSSPTKDTTPDWLITPETPTSTATCSVPGMASPVACTGTWTTPVTLPEGTTTLTVTVTDDLGNITPTTATVLVDITPPGLPAPVPSGSLLTNNPALAWTWDPTDAASATCTLVRDGVDVATGACTALGQHDVRATTPGRYALRVDLVDAVGNSITGASDPAKDVVYETAPPGAPQLLSAPPAARGTATSATWTFTTPGVRTSCTLSSPGQTDRVIADCQAGTAAFTGLVDGTWTLAVVTSSAAGNTASLTPPPTYTVDRTGPTAPTVTGPAGLTNVATPRYVITPTEAGPVTQCRLVGVTKAGVVLDPTWDDCTAASALSLALTEDGTYHVEARLLDDLGNIGATGFGPDLTYDGTPPVAADLSGVRPVTAVVPTLSFVVEPLGSATCVLLQGGAPVDTRDCSSGTWRPPILNEGRYTLSITVRDQAGNATTTTAPLELDTTPPAVPQITAPVSPSPARMLSWAIVGDGTPLTCTLLPNVLTSPVACTTGLTADLTGRPDGLYTLTVTATDTAGNTVTATDVHDLDTTAPAAPTVTRPGAVGNAVTVVWTFDQPVGTRAECRLVSGLAVGAWVGCDGGAFSASDLPDGSYVLEVRLTDLAGNTGVPGASAPYVSDRTAPVAPVLSGPTGPAQLATVTWSWTGEAVAATCRVDRDGVPGAPYACGTSQASDRETVTLPADGSYQFAVRLTDAAGNVSPEVTLPAYLLDRVAPLTPVVGGPTGTGNDPRATYTFLPEAGAAVECRLVQDGVPGPWATCASGDLRTLTTDGRYTLEVRQTDAAGNTSAVGTSPSYLYDATAPAQPSVVAPASPTSRLRPTWSFSSEAGAVASCRVARASALVQDWLPCTSPFSLDLTGLPDGAYVLQVRVTDPAGNTGTVGEAAPYVLDTTAPDAPVVTGPGGPSPLVAPTFTWTGEAGTGAVCQLLLDGVAQGSAGTTCFSPYVPRLSQDGQWVLTVQLFDLAGNRSAVGRSGGYVLDTVPPAAPVVRGPTSPGRATTPSWSAVVEAGSTTECMLTGGTDAAFPWRPCSLPLVTDLTRQPDGLVTLSVRATDAAGLTGPVGSADYLLDTQAPAAPVFTTTPSSPGRTRALSFAWTGETGATFACRLSRGPSVLTPLTTCTSPLPVTLVNLTVPTAPVNLDDGAYTVTVVATDPAGNAGPAATSTYVLDTTPPAAPVLLTGPAALSPDRTPTWTFSSVPGVTFTCKVVSSAGLIGADGPCTSPFTPPALAVDDTWTLTVRAADAAGNSSPPLVTGYQLSSTALVTPDVTGPASPGRSTLAVWQVAVSPATAGRLECELRRGATVLRAWATCGPTYSANLPAEDGTYTVAARVVNARGVASSEVLSRYVLDITGPGAALLTAPTSPGTDRAPVWTITSPEPGATAQCTVLGADGAPLAPTAACPVSESGTPYRLDLVGAVDGTYRLVVRLTDQAGNPGVAVSSAYVLDTGPPNTVLVTPPVSPGNNRAPVWQLVGDTDAVLECRLVGQGIPVAPFAPCAAVPGVPGQGSFTAQITVLEGTFVLTVRSRDGAGNLGPETTSSYAFDSIPPAAPSVPTPPRSPGSSPTVDWTFTSEAGTTALCTLTSPRGIVRPETGCASPFTTELTPFGEDGTFQLSVRVVDTAGNSSPSTSGTYLLSRAPAQAPSIVASPANRSPDTTPTWRVALASRLDVLECQLLDVGAGTVRAPWTACSAAATTTPTSSGTLVTFDLAPSTQGAFQLQARERNAVGFVSPETNSAVYTLDPAAPWTVDVVPPDPQRGRTRNPVFQIVRQAGDTTTVDLQCEVTRFDSVAATVSPCAPGAVTVDLNLDPALTGDGSVVLTVRTVDAAGRRSPRSSAAYHYDDVAPTTPTVSALNADHGYTAKAGWLVTSADPNDAFRCRLVRTGPAGPAAPDYQPCTTPYLASVTAFGTWTFEVVGVDPVGTLSATTAVSTYTYLPPLPLVAPRGPAEGSSSAPRWTFPVPRGLSAACSVTGPGGVSLAVDKDCSTGTFSILLPDVAGSYTLAVVLGDGFTGGTPGLALYRYSPVVRSNYLGDPVAPPVVPGRRPTDGPQRPGTGPGRGPGLGSGPVAGPALPPGQVPGSPAGPDPQSPRGPGRTAPASSSPERPSVPLARPVLPSPALDEVPRILGKAITDLGRRPTIPLVLLTIVVGFLLLQNRIDRRDPKLAEAPMGAEPEMEFGPVLARVPRGSTAAGGQSA